MMESVYFELLAAMKWYRTTSKKSKIPIKLDAMARCTSEIILASENTYMIEKNSFVRLQSAKFDDMERGARQLTGERDP